MPIWPWAPSAEALPAPAGVAASSEESVKKGVQLDEGAAPTDDAEAAAAQERREANVGAGKFATSRGKLESNGAIFPAKPAFEGGPPGSPGKKQMQTEERTAPMDDQERRVLAQRLAHRSATARAHHASAKSVLSVRSAQRSAREDAEQRAARERVLKQREAARRAALRAAAEHTAELERKEAHLQAELASIKAQKERLAEMSSRPPPVLPPSNFRRAVLPPPSKAAMRRRATRNRPEWGEGHAGGRIMQARVIRPKPHTHRTGRRKGGKDGKRSTSPTSPTSTSCASTPSSLSTTASTATDTSASTSSAASGVRAWFSGTQSVRFLPGSALGALEA